MIVVIGRKYQGISTNAIIADFKRSRSRSNSSSLEVGKTS